MSYCIVCSEVAVSDLCAKCEKEVREALSVKNEGYEFLKPETSLSEAEISYLQYKEFKAKEAKEFKAFMASVDVLF